MWSCDQNNEKFKLTIAIIITVQCIIITLIITVRCVITFIITVQSVITLIITILWVITVRCVMTFIITDWYVITFNITVKCVITLIIIDRYVITLIITVQCVIALTVSLFNFTSMCLDSEVYFFFSIMWKIWQICWKIWELDLAKLENLDSAKMSALVKGWKTSGSVSIIYFLNSTQFYIFRKILWLCNKLDVFQ